MLSSIPNTPTLLKLSDKLSLRYQKTGDGPPLVLLHTIRTQLAYFRYLAPLLADNFTVYAVDMPGHGRSPIDHAAPYDEPYLRQGIIQFIERLDLRDVTLVGESIGAVLALTVAAAVPQRIRSVFALNTYDYETRYADGLRRGNLFANVIVGSLQIPIIGPINASLENRIVLRKIMGGGYHDPRKLPNDLVTEFDAVAHLPGYRTMAGKVLSGWRSWAKALDTYANIATPVTLIYGDDDWSRVPERERTRDLIRGARMFTLKDTGHFSAVESPHKVASIVLGS